jgi:trimeric autotransporter adhesin
MTTRIASNPGVLPLTIARLRILFCALCACLALSSQATGQVGTITTVAGNGTCCVSGDGGPATSAGVASPFGLAEDASGNLFVADSSNRIRKISPRGIITTIAGNGTAGFSGDGGIATSSSFYTPNAVAVDASGNLFIADFANNRIRKVSSSGVITTYAGKGPSCIPSGPPCGGFSGDGGPATAASLNMPGDSRLTPPETFSSQIRPTIESER